MCMACTAAQERKEAARTLLARCEEQYGMGVALKGAFPPKHVTPAGMMVLLRRMDEKPT